MFILFITSKIIYASLLTGNWSKLNSHTFSASKKKTVSLGAISKTIKHKFAEVSHEKF